ncbi:MAG: hypothetical protein WC937_02300 [Candidatus Omnitrophota bacterium]|jgi:hypothetical protein|nr:hypothetical protein [Candidatus Omnitrophota bacterium]MDD5518716.1 hypothetical protein [Candidatus Omnitrophota bacterium]
MKKSRNYYRIILFLFLIVTLSGCATPAANALRANESQVKLRSIQTRAFDTTDKKKMMQTVISTMQDLDFVIDKADFLLGSVTGSKFLGQAVVTMSVTVRPRGEKQLLVRANAQYGVSSVEDPGTYQDFFTALEKSIFLTAQQVD